METVRAFIAVDMGGEIREKLDGLQRNLKKVHANVRWVKPQNMHLTLAFLGDLPVEKITPLQTALGGAFQGLEPFELDVAGTGFFGRPNHPSVIWAGIAECPSLMELQRKAVGALHVAEIEFDNRPFSPHLTLGRVKAPHHTESLLGMLEKGKTATFGRTWIDSAELIRSKLSPKGAEYTVLHRVPLFQPDSL